MHALPLTSPWQGTAPHALQAPLPRAEGNRSSRAKPAGLKKTDNNPQLEMDPGASGRKQALRLQLQCGKNFRYSSVLLRHQRAHSSDRRFRCQDCGERCAGAAELRVHRCAHAGQTLYICSDCGQSFRHSSRLDLHQSVHQWRRRSCSCRVCGRRFPHRAALLLHWRCSHSPERPRCCELCARTFRQSALRFHKAQAHPRGTTNTSSLCCTHCPRAFCSRAGLWNHARMHLAHSPGDSAPWQPRARGALMWRVRHELWQELHANATSADALRQEAL
ncbi:zinc finger protein 672 [Rhinolophus ferrumequinum]|uniref:Zinc finger protein 672 n=1 Tax=Rhinolophus ferrumequinum TaxID=59479 RepID=A0A7J7S019_RHIFE|nr:zinc finger protein 672 [Rhinolophus ferrumequinum]